jgi:hypothetical protein
MLVSVIADGIAILLMPKSSIMTGFIIRLDAHTATRQLLHVAENSLPSPGQRNDWPDLLLMDLARNASTEIGAWAEVNGLARETVS